MTARTLQGFMELLPQEQIVMEQMKAVIRHTYELFGFAPLDTPVLELAEVLLSKSGGDTEKQIYEFKKGDTDLAMRFDLTVPLAKYVALYNNDLTFPFKRYQIGKVYRGERPQKGRFREFYQCDIDILGEPSNLAEIELILATTTTLGKLGFQNFQIKINDRQILKAMAAYSGFAQEDYDSVFITLDKMDKIGLEGVSAELEENGFAKESIDKYLDLFKGFESAENGLEFIYRELGDFLSDEVKTGLKEIIDSVSATKSSDFEIVFDPTLVRGMSYYTGTIFEIAMPELGIACGGGGRYDKMIGKFTGKDTPACGFSIGFERIVLLLLESGFQVPNQNKKIAYLIEKGVDSSKLCDIIAEAQKMRGDGTQVLVARMNKNKKFQKETLEAQGYEEFKEFFAK